MPAHIRCSRYRLPRGEPVKDGAMMDRLLACLSDQHPFTAPTGNRGATTHAEDNETFSRPPTDLRGSPAIYVSLAKQRYRGVMRTAPAVTWNIPLRRVAWQIGENRNQRLWAGLRFCVVRPITVILILII